MKKLLFGVLLLVSGAVLAFAPCSNTAQIGIIACKAGDANILATYLWSDREEVPAELDSTVATYLWSDHKETPVEMDSPVATYLWSDKEEKPEELLGPQVATYLWSD